MSDTPSDPQSPDRPDAYSKLDPATGMMSLEIRKDLYFHLKVLLMEPPHDLPSSVASRRARGFLNAAMQLAIENADRPALLHQLCRWGEAMAETEDPRPAEGHPLSELVRTHLLTKE